MNYCIYCKIQEADSEEDYIPRCLGKFRNVEKLKEKICKFCNNDMGKLDEQFCRCGPEAFFRRILGIKGRKHHKPINPYYRGSSGGSHIIIEGNHPTLDCKIFYEAEKVGEAFPARQIIVADSHGKYHSILITEKIQNIEQLLLELETKGLSNSQFIECWALPEEEEWMNRLCECFGIMTNWVESPSFTISEKKLFVTTCTVNTYYFRGVAKIAFHYFLKHFNQFSGHEKEFDGIKKFIIDGGDSDTWVRQKSGSFIVGLGPYITTDKYGHLLTIDKNENDIRVKIQFFVGPGIGPHRYYEVFIGKNPGRIIYSQGIGYQFVYFDEPDHDGYDGRVDALHSIRNSLLC